MPYQVQDLEKFLCKGEIFYRDPVEDKPIYYRASVEDPSIVTTDNPCFLLDPEPYVSSGESETGSVSESVSGDDQEVVDAEQTAETIEGTFQTPDISIRDVSSIRVEMDESYVSVNNNSDPPDISNNPGSPAPVNPDILDPVGTVNINDGIPSPGSLHDSGSRSDSKVVESNSVGPASSVNINGGTPSLGPSHSLGSCGAPVAPRNINGGDWVAPRNINGSTPPRGPSNSSGSCNDPKIAEPNITGPAGPVNVGGVIPSSGLSRRLGSCSIVGPATPRNINVSIPSPGLGYRSGPYSDVNFTKPIVIGQAGPVNINSTIPSSRLEYRSGPSNNTRPGPSNNTRPSSSSIKPPDISNSGDVEPLDTLNSGLNSGTVKSPSIINEASGEVLNSGTVKSPSVLNEALERAPCTPSNMRKRVHEGEGSPPRVKRRSLSRPTDDAPISSPWTGLNSKDSKCTHNPANSTAKNTANNATSNPTNNNNIHSGGRPPTIPPVVSGSPGSVFEYSETHSLNSEGPGEPFTSPPHPQGNSSTQCYDCLQLRRLNIQITRDSTAVIDQLRYALKEEVEANDALKEEVAGCNRALQRTLDDLDALKKETDENEQIAAQITAQAQKDRDDLLIANEKLGRKLRQRRRNV